MCEVSLETCTLNHTQVSRVCFIAAAQGKTLLRLPLLALRLLSHRKQIELFFIGEILEVLARGVDRVLGCRLRVPQSDGV